MDVGRDPTSGGLTILVPGRGLATTHEGPQANPTALRAETSSELYEELGQSATELAERVPAADTPRCSVSPREASTADQPLHNSIDHGPGRPKLSRTLDLESQTIPAPADATELHQTRWTQPTEACLLPGDNKAVCANQLPDRAHTSEMLDSKYIGVSWHKARSKWKSKLVSNRVHETIGYFASEEEAARAYDKAAFQMWGKETTLNFPAEIGTYRKKRGLAAYDTDPEISAESEGGIAGPQDLDDEIMPRTKSEDKDRRKPVRRKRPRLVPPHSRSSQYRGVYWEPKGSKWYSSISSNHKQIHLGSFNTEEEAAQAFDQEALRLRGPGTFTNFPPESYTLGNVDSDTAGGRLTLSRRPSNSIRQRKRVVFRRRLLKEESSGEEETRDEDDPVPSEDEVEELVRPEKDDQAANALLSLGYSPLGRTSSHNKQSPPPAQKRPTPPLSIEPPVTLRGQKRKRGGLALGASTRVEGFGRARSKFTGVYQQSRGHGWFASICVDKSMKYLGTFATEEEAARAFDQEALILRGTGIELNLPHEAEGFMQKLKREEEGDGASPRLGPAPVVSAGPDFEGHMPRQSAPRHLSDPSEEPPAISRRLRSRERRAATRSRRLMGWLARSQSFSSESEEEPEEEEEEELEEEEEPEEAAANSLMSGNELPAWKEKRLRSLPKTIKRADKQPKQGKRTGLDLPSQPRHDLGEATAESPFSSFRPILSPAVNGLSHLGGTPGLPQAAMSPGFQGISGQALNPQQVARPSASYTGFQGLGPAFSMAHAWPAALAGTGSLTNMLGQAPTTGSFLHLPQQPYSQPGYSLLSSGETLQAAQGQDTLNLQALLGRLQSSQLSQLLSQAAGAQPGLSHFPGMVDSRWSQPMQPPQLPGTAFARLPLGLNSTVIPQPLLQPQRSVGFQPPFGMPAPQLSSFPMASLPFQMHPAGVRPGAGPGVAAGAEFGVAQTASRCTPQLGLAARARDQQSGSPALKPGQHSSVKPSIGVK